MNPNRTSQLLLAGTVATAVLVGVAACGGGGGGSEPAANTPSVPAVIQSENALASGQTVTFSYPSFGQKTQIRAQLDEDGSTSVSVIASTADERPIDQFVVGFIPNPTHLSLTNWFRQEVDESGSIGASGGYVTSALSNGVQVLVVTGELPEGHLNCCGPIGGDLYALSPDSGTVIVVASGQDHSFGAFSYAQALDSYKTMLGSMSFK